MSQTAEMSDLIESRAATSNNAARFSNNADQHGFDAVLYQEGANKAAFLHYHDFYEFVIYLGDTPATYRLDRDYQVDFGDIVVCDLMDEHMWRFKNNEQHRRFSVGLSFNFVMSCSTKDDNLTQIFSRNSSTYPILHVGALQIHRYINLLEAFQKCPVKNGQLVYQLSILHQVLAYLQDDFLSQSQGTITVTRQDKMVCDLINYINLHIKDDLSLKVLSKVTNYNATYLSRTFKNLTRTTLKLYIDEKRISTATLLMGKGIPLTEIAQEVGFQNYCTFYNTFKRIRGISPESYVIDSKSHQTKERSAQMSEK